MFMTHSSPSKWGAREAVLPVGRGLGRSVPSPCGSVFPECKTKCAFAFPAGLVRVCSSHRVILITVILLWCAATLSLEVFK